MEERTGGREWVEAQGTIELGDDDPRVIEDGDGGPDEASGDSTALVCPLVDDECQNHQRRDACHPAHRAGNNLNNAIGAWTVASCHLGPWESGDV